MFLPTILTSLPSEVMLLNRSTTLHREIAIPIAKKQPEKVHRSESDPESVVKNRQAELFFDNDIKVAIGKNANHIVLPWRHIKQIFRG